MVSDFFTELSVISVIPNRVARARFFSSSSSSNPNFLLRCSSLYKINEEYSSMYLGTRINGVRKTYYRHTSSSDWENFTAIFTGSRLDSSFFFSFVSSSVLLFSFKSESDSIDRDRLRMRWTFFSPAWYNDKKKNTNKLIWRRRILQYSSSNDSNTSKIERFRWSSIATQEDEKNCVFFQNRDLYIYVV